MIRGLDSQGFIKQVVTGSPEPEVTPQQTPQPASSTGIANFADAFEMANTGNVDYASLLQQAANPVINPDPPVTAPTVDATSIFDFQTATPSALPPEAFQPLVPPETTEPPTAPPPPVEDGLGKTLEGVAESEIPKFYNKKTVKDFGPAPETSTTSEKFGDTSKMPENLSSLGGGGGTTVGGLQGSWNLAEFGKIDEKDQGDWGSAYAKGSTKILALDGQVYYNVGVDTDKKTVTVGGGAKGSIEIIGAHYEAGYSTPGVDLGNTQVDVDAKVNADAVVGAKGSVGAEITLGGENYAHLGAGGFDGARASLAGDIAAGDAVHGTGYLAAWTGIGAKADAEVGFKDGEFSVKVGLGLALGVGAEWDLGFKVDFGRVARVGLNGMKEIGLGDVADFISDTADDTLEFAGDAAHWTGTAVEDAADWTGTAVEDAADWTGTAVEDAAKATADAAKAAAQAAADAAEAAAQATADAAEAAAQAAADAAEAAAQAAADAAKAAAEAGEDIIDGVGGAVEDLFDW